jgi:hypothetical protein
MILPRTEFWRATTGRRASGLREVRPSQICRNLLRERASIRSIGWIRWQAFDGVARVAPSVVEGLPDVSAVHR